MRKSGETDANALRRLLEGADLPDFATADFQELPQTAEQPPVFRYQQDSDWLRTHGDARPRRKEGRRQAVEKSRATKAYFNSILFLAPTTIFPQFAL